MVTDALSPNALPLSVVMVALPAVENVTPAEAMMVPGEAHEGEEGVPRLRK